MGYRVPQFFDKPKIRHFEVICREAKVLQQIYLVTKVCGGQDIYCQITFFQPFPFIVDLLSSLRTKVFENLLVLSEVLFSKPLGH